MEDSIKELQTESPIQQEPNLGDLIHHYFAQLWQILTHPTQFYRQMPIEGGLTGPLTFALVTHWLGAAVSFLWSTLMGQWFAHFVDTFSRIATDVAQRNGENSQLPFAEMLTYKDRLWQWFWGAGSIVIDPFLTLFSILFTSFLVFVGAKIFVCWISPQSSEEKSPPVTYESAARIICYGMAPMILTGIPLFGWGLATFLSAIITIIGAKEVYRVGTFRAIVIALFPKLLFLGFILGSVLIFLTIVIKLLTSLI